MDPDFKIKLYHTCLQLLESKISGVKKEIISLQESMNSESKSTAGDKHETGRAMMQLEIEKLGNQLKEIEAQKAILEKIHVNKFSAIVSKGSLVETDKGYLFFAVGLGKINVEDKTVFVMSPESPLGQKLAGLKVNDSVEINKITYQIKAII